MHEGHISKGHVRGGMTWFLAAASAIALATGAIALATGAGAAERKGTPPSAIRPVVGLSAPAAIAPASAMDLALAMGIPTAQIVSASLGTTDPTAAGVGNTPLGKFFPTNGGTYAILATGAAQTAETMNDSESTSGTLTGLDRKSVV